MSIIKDTIRSALEDFRDTGDEFQLAQEMFHLGDYSIRCQQHAQIGYEMINVMRQEKEKHSKFIKKITDIIYEDQH